MSHAIPSSPPKKLLPAFPAMGKFVAGETNGITHVYRDESDEVLVPGIMSSSPVKRSHVTAFGKHTNAATLSSPVRSSSPAHRSPPPSSPCPMNDMSSDGLHSDPMDSNEVESPSCDLKDIISREPRTALCSLPIVNLVRPSAARLNSLIMEKRVNQNKDLMTKPSTQELLAIMGEYYPPVAVGRSSLQSQVVLSKSNRQISRRHVTTWYDLDRHVIAISCSGWNGCRVMTVGTVFRTPENRALLEEAKVKYGDIFEPKTSGDLAEGQENEKVTNSFGTFLFKNDRMEIDASEILVDVRGERFMIRLSDEGEEVVEDDDDAEMTTDETDDEELVPLTQKSDSKMNVDVTKHEHVAKKQKVDIEVTKPIKSVQPVPSTPADKENQVGGQVTSTPATVTSTPAVTSTPSRTPSTSTTSTPSSIKRSKHSNKPVLKTVKVMKPVSRSVVRQVSRPAGRLEKPELLKQKVKEVKEKAEAKEKPVESQKVESQKVEKPAVKATKPETKPLEKTEKTEKTEKPLEKEIRSTESSKPVEPSKPVETEKPTPVESTKPTPAATPTAISQPKVEALKKRETTPVPQLAKAVSTPKSTPKTSVSKTSTPKTATPKRKAKSPSPEIPLSPSQIDLKAIRNLVCNHLAFSRLSCTPLQTVMAVSPKISMVPKSQLQQILRDIDCIGIIHREGKDASGKPLEEEYYYVPERDSDKDRVKLVNETKGGAGVRSCRKVHKQYYWKKPTL